MNGRGGGCCVARCGGGAYVASKVDRIMLRFRPIAPKPTTGGSVSGINPDSRTTDAASSVRNGRAAKRRCVRERRSTTKKRRAIPVEKEISDVAVVVTLPLLPETPDRKESPPSDLSPSPSPSSDLSLGKQNVPVTVLAPQPVWPVGSWVTLELVTGTCLGWTGLGSTEEEGKVVRSLDEDTCPGFVSDGWNRVTWTNKAYRRMVGGWEGEEMVVGLAMKERIPETLHAFSGRVRVQYTCTKERNSLTVPCDVWRMMSRGGFAWRLDIKAALSLGI